MGPGFEALEFWVLGPWGLGFDVTPHGMNAQGSGSLLGFQELSNLHFDLEARSPKNCCLYGLGTRNCNDTYLRTISDPFRSRRA